MKRNELLETLELVSPALASSDLIPILAHFWFSEKRVMAYNDSIAISAPCTTGINGAVPGNVLLNLLKNSRAKEVAFTSSEKELAIKAGPSSIKLPVMPSEHFVFKMPSPQKKQQSALLRNKQFVSSVQVCLRSVSNDTSKPEHLGISLIPNKDQLEFYSTDSTTITHTRLPVKREEQIAKRVILSAPFCQQLTALASKQKLTELEIMDDHVIVRTDEGVSLFGRLIEVGQPVNFQQVMDTHIPDKYRKQLIPMPPTLRLVLERATVITSLDVERTRTSIKVRDSIASFFTKSRYAEVADKLKFTHTHKDVAINVEARRLKEACGDFDHLLFCERCVIFAKGGAIHLISAFSK